MEECPLVRTRCCMWPRIWVTKGREPQCNIPSKTDVFFRSALARSDTTTVLVCIDEDTAVWPLDWRPSILELLQYTMGMARPRRPVSSSCSTAVASCPVRKACLWAMTVSPQGAGMRIPYASLPNIVVFWPWIDWPHSAAWPWYRVAVHSTPQHAEVLVRGGLVRRKTEQQGAVSYLQHVVLCVVQEYSSIDY